MQNLENYYKIYLAQAGKEWSMAALFEDKKDAQRFIGQKMDSHDWRVVDPNGEHLVLGFFSQLMTAAEREHELAISVF